jgi:hypothetical protein
MSGEGIRSYKAFKKEWMQKRQNEEKRAVEKMAKERVGEVEEIKVIKSLE